MPRRGWGSGRGSYLYGAGAEPNNNDPALRLQLVFPRNTVNKTRARPQSGDEPQRDVSRPEDNSTAARHVVVASWAGGGALRLDHDFRRTGACGSRDGGVDSARPREEGGRPNFHA
jgi:hypothetical protein